VVALRDRLSRGAARKEILPEVLHDNDKGTRKNNFAFFAPRFGSGLDDPIEQNRRTSPANLRILRLRIVQIWSEDGMRKA
jgi:hypothetical protein